MLVSVSRAPGMESQEVPSPCSVQQLRKVAQRCARLQFFNFLYFELIGHVGYLHYGFLAPGNDSQGHFGAYTLRWPIFGDI